VLTSSSFFSINLLDRRNPPKIELGSFHLLTDYQP
jgi:hypothetical protein